MAKLGPLAFEIVHRANDCAARVGRVTTPHGSFDTPAFMPVGTQAAVKGLTPAAVAGTGSQILLANTYHLMLRPGCDLVAALGGLHAWMRWPKPILTDSGGFQVFSLADVSRVTDAGVTFRSHVDGATVELTPQRSMQVQNQLGADIIMAFDDCPPAQMQAGGSGPGSAENGLDAALESMNDRPSNPPRLTPNPPTPAPSPRPRAPRHALPADQYAARVQQACERSVRWLDACLAAHGRKGDQAMFGIVQGGTDLRQRTWCVEHVCSHDLPGYAIGGVAVGEGFTGLKKVVEHTCALLPADRPRYLMGVGYERDILAAVRAGVDMFDCVLPTRNARNANAFTPMGQIRLRNAGYARDPAPIDPACDCPACGGGFSRSYLRHLFLAGEMLGPILVTLHNLRHFQRYLLDIRTAIADNDWSLIKARWPAAG